MPSGAGEMLSAFGDESFLTEDFVAKLQEAAGLLEALNAETEAFSTSLQDLATSGAVDLFTAMGVGMVDATKGAREFGRVVTDTMAAAVVAVGDYLAKMAVVYALAGQWGKAAAAAGGAAIAYVGGGAIGAAGAQASQSSSSNQRAVQVNVYGDITDADRTTAKIVGAVRSMRSPV